MKNDILPITVLLLSLFAAPACVADSEGLGPDQDSEDQDSTLEGARSALSGLVAVDLVLRATDINGSFPVRHYSTIGYWDVDKGGSVSRRDNSTGTGMMSLYVRWEAPGASECITDIGIIASDAGAPPPAPQGYSLAGYWDVDKGGGAGYLVESSGAYMMGLYVKKGMASPGDCVTDVLLRASDASTPLAPQGYVIVGYWDVGGWGAYGTDGSFGNYTVTLSYSKN